MRQTLLITTALSSLAFMGVPLSAHAAITTTTTTTYTYDFPSSTPTSREDIRVDTNCPVRYNDGGGGGDRGGGDSGGSYGDSDGDGVSDSGGYTSDPPGSDDGWGDGGQTQSSPGQDSWGGGGGGSDSAGRVICTYFYQKGELDAPTYYADMEYTRTYLRGATVRGYHFWAIPYARAMRTNPGGWLEAIIRPVTIHRARELAYQMGVAGSQPDYLGKAFRLLIEPLCLLIGQFVSEGQWHKLYSPEEMKAYAADYQIYNARRTFEENIHIYRLAGMIHQ